MSQLVLFLSMAPNNPSTSTFGIDDSDLAGGPVARVDDLLDNIATPSGVQTLLWLPTGRFAIGAVASGQSDILVDPHKLPGVQSLGKAKGVKSFPLASKVLQHRTNWLQNLPAAYARVIERTTLAPWIYLPDLAFMTEDQWLAECVNLFASGVRVVISDHTANPLAAARVTRAREICNSMGMEFIIEGAPRTGTGESDGANVLVTRNSGTSQLEGAAFNVGSGGDYDEWSERSRWIVSLNYSGPTPSVSDVNTWLTAMTAGGVPANKRHVSVGITEYDTVAAGLSGS